MRFPGLAMVSFLPECGRCVSKVCSCEHKPTFELHGRTLLSYAPACTVFRGSLSFTPGAVGRAPSFWLPLAGYARQHPERQEWRAVPALDSRRIYVNFRGGGDGGRVRLGCLLEFLLFIKFNFNPSCSGFRTWRWFPFCQGADVVFKSLLMRA